MSAADNFEMLQGHVELDEPLRRRGHIRTHRSLNKDAPVSRPLQRTGVISSRAILGGLHHRYARV
jgi:hypothetical protein